MRVVTVTSTEAEGGASWQIGVHTLETLAGGTPAGTDWTASRREETPPRGCVCERSGGHLVQRPFILCLRTFAPARGDGGGALHFHLAGEDEDQLGAVRRCSAPRAGEVARCCARARARMVPRRQRAEVRLWPSRIR